MAKKKVKVRNTLDFDVKIKEGNAGVYAQKGIVKPGQTFKLELDGNATYREYVLITLPDNTELPVFSSDDLGEISKEIVVMQKEGSNPPEYYWQGDPIIPKPSHKNKGDQSTKNDGGNNVGDSSRTDEAEGAETSSPGLFQRIWEALRVSK